jgi:hypothetical protein
MSDVQQDDAGPIIVWQFFTPFPDTVRREENLQGALRRDIALFEEAAKKTTAWMDRRQVAFETGLKALSDLSTCKDPVSAVAIWGRWLNGSINRIAADLSDAQDFGVKAAAVGRLSAQAMVEGFPASGRTMLV